MTAHVHHINRNSIDVRSCHRAGFPLNDRYDGPEREPEHARDWE